MPNPAQNLITRKSVIVLLVIACIASGLAFFAPSKTDISSPSAPQTVNVYSYRQPDLIQPLFDAFTRETGIEVKTVFANKGLIERVMLEGERSPVDVILTSNFHHLAEAGEKIAQAVNSKQLTQHIPRAFRDPQNKWFSVTLRARVLFAAKDRVSEEPIIYEDLADPKWQGRLCMRSGQHPYNLSLFAAMMARHGEAWTRNWLLGVKENLARKPAGNDRAQVKQIYAGQCDLALANTYYMGNMQFNDKNPEQKQWAKNVRLIFPTSQKDDNNFGTHINVSGMVMAKHAPHPDAALAFMEFMLTPQAQKIYAEANYEYPVRADVAPAAFVAAWGSLKPDTTPLAEIAQYYKKASYLVDEINFNQ